MSKKNEKEEIYNLCKEFYDYENFINYHHYHSKHDCFLIEKELFDSFKNNIFYEQLKDSIKKNIDFKHIDKNILNKIKKIKKNIVQIKFKNKQELLNELEKGKIFYVITAQLFNNICKGDKKNEKEIEAVFHRGKIRLFFKDKKEKIDFKYNKDGTIEKSNIYNKETEKEGENQNDNNPQILSKEKSKIINKEPILNNQIINNIQFLTGFYLFYEDIKNQSKKSDLYYKDYEKGYLINEKLFELYSNFYDYNNLKEILKLEIEKNKNLSNDENIEKISNELIKNIPKDLKEKYINGFNEFNELIKDNELYSASLK